MPVVKDKLVYNKKNNKNKGYFVKDGRKKLPSETVNLRLGRSKKKLKSR